jgi:hypothetical protein
MAMMGQFYVVEKEEPNSNANADDGLNCTCICHQNSILKVCDKIFRLF